MRPSKYCEHFRPWLGTSRGELNEVCVDEQHHTATRCTACIDVINQHGNNIYRHWKARIKEVGNDRILEPELWGYYTLEQAKAHFGLDEADVEWYTIDDMNEEGGNNAND